MHTVSCPLCGRDPHDRLFAARDRLGLSGGEFTLVRCRSCGLVYLNPRPDEGGLAACYPREYWGGREKGPGELVRGVEERAKELYKLRALKGAGILSGRVLDIGCGRGEFLALIRARGFEVAGIEPGAEAAARGRADFGLDITHGTLGEAELPEGGFDVVTMWHVLEHFPDPLAALKAARRALRPGGKLVAALPDFGGWQARSFREGWYGIDAPRHLTHFTGDTLAAMMGKAGFAVERVLRGGVRYEAAMLVRSIFPGLNRMKLDAVERRRPSRYVYKAAQLLLDALFLPAGFSIVAAGAGSMITAVARKDGASGA